MKIIELNNENRYENKLMNAASEIIDADMLQAAEYEYRAPCIISQIIIAEEVAA